MNRIIKTVITAGIVLASVAVASEAPAQTLSFEPRTSVVVFTPDGKDKFKTGDATVVGYEDNIIEVVHDDTGDVLAHYDAGEWVRFRIDGFPAVED